VSQYLLLFLGSSAVCEMHVSELHQGSKIILFSSVLRAVGACYLQYNVCPGMQSVSYLHFAVCSTMSVAQVIWRRMCR
jgi:hypothetical protein